MTKSERQPRQRVELKFPAELLKKVEDYQKESAIGTRAETIYELIRKGLNAK
ncbi:hypothetical protein [Ectobacillus funiculus]|uniref:CopG family transcriptional regulator n=1 Tax=Ectobacillus funiculus TaxID=137993 RepID=A0ABV5W8P0_9BACI